MAEWMYAHTLPVDMHPQGCTCGGCGVDAEALNVEGPTEADLRQCTCDCGCMYQTTSEICPDCKNGDHVGYAELY